MAWTYSGDPSNNDKDAVRFLIFDTDVSDQLLTDEEILYLLSVETTVIRAAYRAATALAAKFARLVNESVGSISVSCGEKYKNYLALCKKLKAQYQMDAAFSAAPYAGGISCDDKYTTRQNTDRIQPAFSRNTLSPTDRVQSGESDDCNDDDCD